ncbi:MAG: hypothetical protein KF900_00260 [Bacteroidetes bacterium]|nr:hypothetical protein [Bacteroidota bacterium]
MLHKISAGQRWFFMLVLVAIMAASLYYSLIHYSDGGCDGGLCALGIIFHGVPLFFSWIFTFLAFGFYAKKRLLPVVFLIISIFIAAYLLTLEYGYRGGKLKNPVYIIFVVQGILLLLLRQKYGEESDS